VPRPVLDLRHGGAVHAQGLTELLLAAVPGGDPGLPELPAQSPGRVVACRYLVTLSWRLSVTRWQFREMLLMHIE